MTHVRKKLRTVLVCLAAFSLVAALSACGAKSEDERPLQRGTTEGNTYTSTFAGFGCTLGEEWTFRSEEELLEMAGIVAGAVSDEELSELLQQSNVVYDMYASRDEGRCSINVVYEKLRVLQSLRYDEEKYLNERQEQLSSALYSMGFALGSVSLGTTEFAGRTCQNLVIDSSYNGVPFYEELVVIKRYNYMIAVTFGSYGENTLGEMKAAFFEVEG